jgi:hypothetical protein
MMPAQELTKSYSSEFEKRAADLTELMRVEIAAELMARLQADADEEIALTMVNLQKKDAEIAGAEGNETFNLGVLLKLKSERLELASYLKGVQFFASKVGKP